MSSVHVDVILAESLGVIVCCSKLNVLMSEKAFKENKNNK